MIDTRKIKKLLILNIPYIIVGLIATNIGEAWRMAEGADSSAKLLSLFSVLPVAFGNPMPSFHPLDLLIGIVCGAGLRLAVYLRSKNAKKYRHNVEYGSARWGTAKDIEPFMAPKFEDNVILTKTERSASPPIPVTVLIIIWRYVENLVPVPVLIECFVVECLCCQEDGDYKTCASWERQGAHHPS